MDADSRTHDELTDEELDDIGMYRCACGGAGYPTGDPDSRHCVQDDPEKRR